MMDKATISTAASTISKEASYFLYPIASQRAHQETYVVPWQMALSTNKNLPPKKNLLYILADFSLPRPYNTVGDYDGIG